MFSKVLSDLLAVGVALVTPFIFMYAISVISQRKFTPEVLFHSAPRVALAATLVVVAGAFIGAGYIGVAVAAFVAWKNYTLRDFTRKMHSRHDPEGFALNAR